MSGNNHNPNGMDEEKAKVAFSDGTAHEASAPGHRATDKYGNSVVNIDQAAEKKLLKKLDFRLLPTVALLYLFCFIDRANIGNARLAGLEKDLHLTGTQYNSILSVFYISYILFEIPGTMACKYIGPRKFIPTVTLIFGLLSVCTGLCKSVEAISGVRFLLGIFEAPMMPGIAYYLSRWYRRSELAFRLSLYMVMAPLAGAFGGLLASAILKLKHFGGLKSWRMIFAVEGIITMGLALIAYFTLTDRPETASWLDRDEKEMAIARIKAERIGTTEVLDRFDRKKIVRGMFSPVTLGTAAIFLLNNITVISMSFFLPTIIASIYPKAPVIQQQLRTVPPYVVGAFFTVLVPYISWKIDRRAIFFLLSTPTLAAGFAVFLATRNAQARFGATFLITSSAYTFGALSNAQVSANVVSDAARSTAIGTNVMFGNMGGLISTWTYLPWDKPDYKIGNGLNLAAVGLICIISTVLILWMNRDNAKRDRKQEEGYRNIEGLSAKELQDLDWKHPGFRWKT